MAKTVVKKIEVAKRVVDLACGEFGLPAHFVYIDPLTFTLATGDPESADAANSASKRFLSSRRNCPGPDGYGREQRIVRPQTRVAPHSQQRHAPLRGPGRA